MKLNLNKQAARSKADAGLIQAIATAEKNHPNWAENAYKFFKKWLSRKPSGYRFQIEQFRLHIQINGGLPKPESDRAFGGLPRRAREEKLIKAKGPKPTTSERAHSCYSMEWQKV